VKADDADRAGFEREDLEPFRPSPDRSTKMSDAPAPEEAMEDPRAPLERANRGLAAALRASGGIRG
jgi:hypothetical protein